MNALGHHVRDLALAGAGEQPLAGLRVSACLDREVARLKLAAMGVRIDKLTAGQQAYVVSWREGT